MSTQETKNEPVLMLDDKKYLIENLSDDAKLVIAALQNLGVQQQEHQLQGLQLQAASESLSNKLKELVEDSPSEDEIGEDTPVM
ncbi:DUF6447 family protein [Phenylobacterium sp.]|uniref:DUF6447 family protein n=1 Tax=Phenylobacterium sp. TaxID=1871053 RepID=UPI0025E1DA92|nr:DUF6447 family protein [Phenylobacterium sp.]|tara:strand:+ start:114 stop:365 length:252 start_codon:yes stop_codon:yes gene_type:complete